MPNHTANKFTVSGPKNDVLRLIANAKGDHDASSNESNNLDFNRLVPMPDELRNTSSPVRIQTQEEIDKIWAEWNKKKEAGQLNDYELREGKPFGLGISQAKHDELIAKYGCADWYNWSVRNWGTKWNAYDVGEWEVIDVDENTVKAVICYETAWSPATELWLTVSQDYPTLEFFHEFADEGGGFLANETIANGSVINEESFDWTSDEGIELREKLGRYYPEDEDEDN